MNEDDIRRRLAEAPEGFPVRGWSSAVHQRVIRRRRLVAGLTVSACALVAAGVSVVILMVAGWGSGSELSPASPANYVGSSWRLTSVSDGWKVMPIPASVGARMDLFPGGQVLIDDGSNALSGRFTISGNRMNVGSFGSTFALSDGTANRLTAVAAFGDFTTGNLAGTTPDSMVWDTIVSVSGTKLVVRTSKLQLTFARIGPAIAPGSAQPTG